MEEVALALGSVEMDLPSSKQKIKRPCHCLARDLSWQAPWAGRP